MRSCVCSPDGLRARLACREWRLIEDEAAPGAWNMAADEALLEAARRDAAPPTLRLYRWARPTLSLGRHQDPQAGIDHDFRHRRGIDQVRRPTGGRAVLHDREVTYSLILPRSLGRGAGVGEVYQVLTGALLAGLNQAFRRAGVQEHCVVRIPYPTKTGPPGPLPDTKYAVRTIPPNPASCFATAAGGDALAGAGKLVGSAQARRAGAVLQHGSVLLQVRREDWVGLFGSAGLEVALEELIGAAPEEAAVRAALRQGLQRELEAALVPGTIAAAERSLAERLVAERYGAGCLD
jgi:lipoate-protein ligase A